MHKRKLPAFLMIGIMISVLAFFLIYIFTLFSPSNQAMRVVEDFYSFEQEADFAESWELFHPNMKKRWDKGTYIQDRSHVFIGHFGSETFDFTIEKADELKGWKMSKEFPPFDTVYKFQVLQMYKGKYGKFNFEQIVYVVKNKGEWVIVWDYNE